jgi:predicted permease
VSVRVWLSRALELLLRGRRETRLRDEIQAHLDQLADEHIARGMSPADARLAARRAFGAVDATKEAYRDQRGLPWFDAALQDLRFAARLLWRDPAFSVTAILVLAIGIGVNNMLFTIVNAHTIRGLPLHQPDRVVYVSAFDDRHPNTAISFADFQDLRDGARDVVRLAAFGNSPVVIAGDGIAADRVDGADVSHDAFGVLGIQPLLGRGFTADDDRPGAAPVVILGEGTWAARYGSDRGILGRSIAVDGRPAVIVGIMRERSGFPGTAEVWRPLSTTPGLDARPRDARSLSVIGRVRDGAAVEEARAAIESVADRLSRDFPATNTNVRARVVPINERFLGSLREPAWRAFLAVGFLVVFISAANVANLVLATSLVRTREIAIRSALGASRRRVVRQLLTEGLLLGVAGGLAGLGAALAGARLFRSAIPAQALPYWFDYSIDARVLAALVSVSLGTVMVFAVLPAVRASKADVTGVLKDSGGTGAPGRGTRRLMTAFLTAEFGLAVVLLAHATLGVRSDPPGVASDAAIDSSQIVTAVLTLAREAYPSPQERSDFYARLRARVASNPGVQAVALTSAAPVQGAPEAPIEIDERPSGASDPPIRVRTVLAGPGYFDTLGQTVIRGRGFADEDGAPGRAFAIVNERMARQLFEDQDPIGRRISVPVPGSPDTARPWFTIVGVAPDIRQRAVPDPDPVVYLPLGAAAPASATLLVRARGDGPTLVPTLRSDVQALDANLPLYRIRTLAQAIRDARWNGRLAASLVLALTIIAVGLATAGLYAVTAYGVTQRRHEIGLRMALGARTRQVASLVVGRVAMQLGLGFAAGVVLTLLWDRTFPGRSDTLRITAPSSLAIVALTLAALAAIACWVPVRRAARLAPLDALRRAP